MALVMTPIYTRVLTDNQTNAIVFNNIPQVYTDLKLVISARAGGTGDSSKTNFYLRFNGNTETVYSNTHVYGLGSSGTGSARDPNTNLLFMGVVTNSDATTNTFANAEVYIPNYAGANFKSAIGDSVAETNASVAVQIFNAGLWRKTDAITSMTVGTISGQNYAQHSSFSLYGIIRSGA